MTGTYTDQDDARWLAWEGCRNARDLGGYRTTDGRHTRRGAIARSDELSPLTAAGQATLIADGIRTIIDLRAPNEQTRAPNPFATPGNHSVAYANLPLNDPDALAVPVHYGTLTDDHSLADDYRDRLTRYARRIGAILTAIARAPAGGVLIHCAAGKDRTGIVCALLLDLVGVDHETIAADYALSAMVQWPEDAEWLALAYDPGERATRERDLARWAARPEVMHAILAHLDVQYDGAVGYLRQSGMTPDDLALLHARLVVP